MTGMSQVVVRFLRREELLHTARKYKTHPQRPTKQSIQSTWRTIFGIMPWHVNPVRSRPGRENIRIRLASEHSDCAWEAHTKE